MIIGIIAVSIFLFISYKAGFEEGRMSEAEKQFNKCEKCGRGGVNNVD